MQVQLGDRVREMISGFEGVVTGLCQYLTGCEQALVNPGKIKEDGELVKNNWFDVDRLQLLEAGAIKIAVTAPGPDTPAPNKN